MEDRELVELMELMEGSLAVVSRGLATGVDGSRDQRSSVIALSGAKRGEKGITDGCAAPDSRSTLGCSVTNSTAEEIQMSDEVGLGRSDKKGRTREAAVGKAVEDGLGSVDGVRRSLAKVDKNFSQQAKTIVDRAEKAFADIDRLVGRGEYSDVGDVVDAFEQANAADLRSLRTRVGKRDYSLTMVAVLVENLGTVRNLAAGL
jgi:hypothetical protein